MTTATTTRVANLTELAQLEGQILGTSSWITIPQDRINTFADATDDHQWIHVDPERAKAESPFGGPIAHGYLTLSLIIRCGGSVESRQRYHGRQLWPQQGALHQSRACRRSRAPERHLAEGRASAQGRPADHRRRPDRTRRLRTSRCRRRDRIPILRVTIEPSSLPQQRAGIAPYGLPAGVPVTIAPIPESRGRDAASRMHGGDPDDYQRHKYTSPKYTSPEPAHFKSAVQAKRSTPLAPIKRKADSPFPV